ncbi:hypothetical protein M8C13_36265 [Crossiella sp. SN42]|uniref:hypothetical protein n=1 Tax=Crossiella sp. SN42 TaxID=2944808 RepID=UPI00207CAFDC|nr:hypothetical protein [Crossiella sp. SN42]MCO1581219.1 hypothetical protein [Crossiella sp. SN42]
MLRINQMKRGAILAWALFGLLTVLATVLASITAAVSKVLAGVAQVGDAACVQVRMMPSAARPGLVVAGGQR